MNATSKAERAAAAYKDLESDICDLRNMSDLTNSFIEESLSGLKRQSESSDERGAVVTEREADIILFAVYHVEKMTKDLQEKFYAIVEAEAL